MVKAFFGRVAKAGLYAVFCSSTWMLSVTSFAQPPSPTMSFAPELIGVGMISTLTMTLSNDDSSTPASDLAIALNLAAGLEVATPSNASTDCVNGILSAPEGGGTITLSDARLGALSTCTLQVDATGNSGGSYENVSGDLTSSAGNGGSATATLTISETLPTLVVSFVPASVPLGGTSTITYLLQNPPGGTSQQSLDFRNALPPGMAVADPANVSTTCDASFRLPLTARPGDTEIGFSLFLPFPGFAPGASCTTEVDVTASAAGTLGNTTGSLTESSGAQSGKAGAVLDVTFDPLNLGGFFSGDPVPPGGTLFLDFTIGNFNRDFAATDIAFTNDLDAALTGLTALGLPMNDVCGAGSTISGSSTISLSGGSLPPGGTCSFRIELQVPTSAGPGTYVNMSSAVTAEIDARAVTGSAAVDSFEINEAPSLEKRFVTNPLPGGQELTMELTITSVSADEVATDIGFVDDLGGFIPGLLPVSLPADFCGAGSTLALTDDGLTRSLVMTGGTLAAQESCTFQVAFDVPLSVPSGLYVNRTDPITATVGGTPVVGRGAEAELELVAAPQLRKSFAEAKVAPGDSVTLTFELSLGESSPGDATGISFDDDLNAMLPGLEAVGLPLADVCGSGSRLEGTSVLTFTGGTVAPLGSCAFDVTLTVPPTADDGSYTNATSEVSATVGGLSVLGAAASANLEVTSVFFEKEFLQDPSFAGDTVPLRFTITNRSPDQAATNMFFTDALNSVLPGLTAVGLTATDVCGAGSSIDGTTFLIFTDGNLPEGGSCSFDVDVEIPPDTETDAYVNATSPLSFSSGGVSGVTSGATAVLNVGEPLSFEKTFDADVVAPGNTVNLEFTIANAHPTLAAEQLSFDDDLSEALEGLEALGLPLSDVCGAGSMLTGSDVITLNDGAVAPGSSCTFSVELQVPDDVGVRNAIVNETSVLTGMVGNFTRTAPPARDMLTVNLISLEKEFEGPAEQGGSTTLTFTVQNLNSMSMVTGIDFSDDLDAVVSGLAATGTPVEDVCGEGSALDGTGVLMLRDGVVAAGDSCTFSVTIAVPLAAPPGDYENVTSALSTFEGIVGDPATATLTVVPRTIEDGGVDGGPDGGPDGGTDGGGGGGCGCRTTSAGDVPVWLLAWGLFVISRWRRRARRGTDR